MRTQEMNTEEEKKNHLPPISAIITATMTIVGGGIGALLTGYFNNKTNIELEQIKFETNLIIKTMEGGKAQISTVKGLKFIASAGLIPHYEARISKLVDEDNGIAIPTAALQQTPDAISPVNYFTYETSSTEVEPGKRVWKHINPSIWTETYPGGKTSFFDVKIRALLGKCAGTVLGKQSEQNFQVFVSDRNCDSPSLWFRRNSQDWIYLARMLDIK